MPYKVFFFCCIYFLIPLLPRIESDNVPSLLRTESDNVPSLFRTESDNSHENIHNCSPGSGFQEKSTDILAGMGTSSKGTTKNDFKQT